MKRRDKDTHCAQGHELVGDNVRTVKVCKACNHERVRDFRARKEPVQNITAAQSKHQAVRPQ
jgi:hypothetical protein